MLHGHGILRPLTPLLGTIALERRLGVAHIAIRIRAVFDDIKYRCGLFRRIWPVTVEIWGLGHNFLRWLASELGWLARFCLERNLATDDFLSGLDV